MVLFLKNLESEMMNYIEVTRKAEEQFGSWVFIVDFGHDRDRIAFQVRLDRDYWAALTGEGIDPKDFVKEVFLFLINQMNPGVQYPRMVPNRQGKFDMRRDFHVREIAQQFPHFEGAMHKRFQTTSPLS